MPVKGWRSAVIQSLIVTELASTLTVINLAGAAWLTTLHEGMRPWIERVLFWPVGSLIWRGYFTVERHLSNEDLRARLQFLVAVTWLKYAAIIIVVHWVCKKWASGWLAARRDVLVACVCPCLLILLLEAPSVLGRSSDSQSEVISLSLPVANLFVLLGIARLPWPRIRRAVCSFPFWLAWIWWWRPFRFAISLPIGSLPADEDLLVLVPMLGFALYAMALEANVEGATELSRAQS